MPFAPEQFHQVRNGYLRKVNRGRPDLLHPPYSKQLLIEPTDAVQWVLYYPPLSEANAVGDIPAVAQCRGLQAPADQACLTHRAEVLLRRGQISDAQRAIDETLSLNPANADANALRAIIEIAANNVVEAREIATAATASAPNEYRTWLALSYAQQAAFDLNAALESAQKAQALQPALALTNARVAELLLSLGRFNEAERSAQKAVDANPNEASRPLDAGLRSFSSDQYRSCTQRFRRCDCRPTPSNPYLGSALDLYHSGRRARRGPRTTRNCRGPRSVELAVRSYVGRPTTKRTRRREMRLRQTSSDWRRAGPEGSDALVRRRDLAAVAESPGGILGVAQDVDKKEWRPRRLPSNCGSIRTMRPAPQIQPRCTAISDSSASRSSRAPRRSMKIQGSSPAHELLATSYSNLPRYDVAGVSEALQAQIRQPLSLSMVPLPLRH